MKKLYITCFPFKFREKEIRELFEKYGKVERVEFFSDFKNATFESYAYVHMNDKGAILAINSLDGIQIETKYLKIYEFRKPRAI